MRGLTAAERHVLMLCLSGAPKADMTDEIETCLLQLKRDGRVTIQVIHNECKRNPYTFRTDVTVLGKLALRLDRAYKPFSE